jgi:hypothetical protein
MLLLGPELADWFENFCHSLNWISGITWQLAGSSGNLIQSDSIIFDTPPYLFGLLKSNLLMDR